MTRVPLQGLDDLDLALWPRAAPITARADRRPAQGLAAGTLELARSQALDRTEIGILNPLFGAPALHNPDLAAALCRATNDWIAREWLDREPACAPGS